MVRLFITALALLLGSVPALAETPLSDYRADVQAVRHGAIDIKSSGYISFNHANDQQWQFKMKFTDGPVNLTESSEGTIVDGIYRPVEFERRMKFIFYRENVNWNFDWAKKVVTGSIKKDDYSYPLSSIIHDPNSFQIPMRQQLMQGETTFNFRYLRWSRPNDLQFKVIGEELLDLEQGRAHTLIIQQIKPLRNGEKKLIWVAKDHQFIPLRFKTYEDGKLRDELIVKKLWIDGKPVSFSQ